MESRIANQLTAANIQRSNTNHVTIKACVTQTLSLLFNDKTKLNKGSSTKRRCNDRRARRFLLISM